LCGRKHRKQPEGGLVVPILEPDFAILDAQPDDTGPVALLDLVEDLVPPRLRHRHARDR
jgi:hypothetical protein